MGSRYFDSIINALHEAKPTLLKFIPEFRHLTAFLRNTEEPQITNTLFAFSLAATMVATNLKSETKSLMDQREAMEAEMNALIETLSGPGGPGLSGNLTDSEGFPRSDIDVNTVRAQRKRLTELRNDHKDITDRIQKNIEILHSAKLPQNADTKNQGTSTSSENHPMEVDSVIRIPFAMIDEIAEDSPAAEDGLQLGDEIVKFGNVEIGERLQERFLSEAQSNQGCPVSVVVNRRGVFLDLTVTPRPWRGRGLLGCHFLFL